MLFSQEELENLVSACLSTEDGEDQITEEFLARYMEWVTSVRIRNHVLEGLIAGDVSVVGMDEDTNEPIVKATPKGQHKAIRAMFPSIMLN